MMRKCCINNPSVSTWAKHFKYYINRRFASSCNDIQEALVDPNIYC